MFSSFIVFLPDMLCWTEIFSFNPWCGGATVSQSLGCQTEYTGHNLESVLCCVSAHHLTSWSSLLPLDEYPHSLLICPASSNIMKEAWSALTHSSAHNQLIAEQHRIPLPSYQCRHLKWNRVSKYHATLDLLKLKKMKSAFIFLSSGIFG